MQSMASSTRYAPGPAARARIQKEGKTWALIARIVDQTTLAGKEPRAVRIAMAMEGRSI
jgi:hypothetical protein